MKAGTFLALGLLLAAVVAGIFLPPLRPWFIEFEGYVKSLGTLGPALVVLIYILSTVFFIPGSAVTIGSGTLFGLKTGFCVVLIGANLGALCSFLLARTLARERVARWAEGNPKFRSLDRAIGKQGFKVVLLTRLSPVFPFVLLNYFLGLTAVRTGAYAAATLLGMTPAMFLFVYIGAAAREALAGPIDPTAGFYQQILKYLGLIATAGVVLLATRLARAALREAEAESAGVGDPPIDPHPVYGPKPYEEMVSSDDPDDRKLIDAYQRSRLTPAVRKGIQAWLAWRRRK